MDANLFSLNATLIQGATMKDLENMISRLLDEKLANVASPTIEVIRISEEKDYTGLKKQQENWEFPLLL